MARIDCAASLENARAAPLALHRTSPKEEKTRGDAFRPRHPAVSRTENGLRAGAPKTGRNARMSEFGVTNYATPRAKNRAGPRFRPGTTHVRVLHALSAKTRRSAAGGAGVGDDVPGRLRATFASDTELTGGGRIPRRTAPSDPPRAKVRKTNDIGPNASDSAAIGPARDGK